MSGTPWVRCVLVAGLACLPSLVFAQAGFSLEAPTRAHIRQSIEVMWSIPEGASAMLEIHPPGEKPRRVGYAYLQANPQTMTVPEIPGSYRIVLVSEREVRASQALEVEMADASISTPTSAGAGESIAVQWSGPINRSDHLTFASRGGDPIRGSSYAYVGNLRGGDAKLRAPADAGEYDVVYVTGRTVLARAPVSVGQVSAELNVVGETHAGASVLVGWNGPENAQDFITFADRDGDRIDGASYSYVANAGDDRQGSLRAPEEPGAYDVVYLSRHRIIGRAPIDVVEATVTIQAPQTVTAHEQFDVAWKGLGNAGDVLRLLRIEDDALAGYGYVDPNTQVVTLTAPKDPGEYLLRYVTRGGAERARQPISVLPAPQPPGHLLVLQSRALLSREDAVGVILDASGSMLQRIGDERRIAIARNTLQELVAETIPEGTGFALRVFGHREADSCRSDLEIPLAPLDRDRTLATIASINAMNLARTPLGHSLALAADDLANVNGRRVLIVLTDGEETCDGDAALAIQALRERGWDIRVNVVGFAIEDPELEETFRAWAAAGAGRYFAATNASDLRDALTRAATGPYEVLNPDSGEAVATGMPGENLTLPAGSYLLRSGDTTQQVDISSDEQTTVTL